MTKTQEVKVWKENIASKTRWAIRALLAIYEFQTAEEQVIETTKEKNGVGFNGVDAEILTSFAKQVQAGRTLSAKQMAIVFKKMPKYAGQLQKLVSGKV